MSQPLPADRLTPDEIAAFRAAQAAPKGIDWAKVREYLPELRSLAWMAAGLLTGAGGVGGYQAVIAPASAPAVVQGQGAKVEPVPAPVAPVVVLPPAGGKK